MNNKKPPKMDAGTNTGQNETFAAVPVAVPIAANAPPSTISNPASIQTPAVVQSTTIPPQAAVSAASVPNLITVPVPIVHNEENYVYVMIKGSLHDRSCSVFGLNEEETQAVAKRFENVKPVVNGIMVSVPPVDMVNTLAQLNYKVICSSGEAEICWTMQREI